MLPVHQCPYCNGWEHRDQRLAAFGEGKAAIERGRALVCDAMFFNTREVQRSGFPKAIGCVLEPDGGVRTDARQCTGVPGVYLAGDAHEDVQFVIPAAAQGAIAATAINRELQEESRQSTSKSIGGSARR